MSKQRAKGTAAETAVVNYLRAEFPKSAHLIERRALHGTQDRGDIAGLHFTEAAPVILEVKNCKALTLAEWMKELAAEKKNAGAVAGAVIAKKRGTTNPAEWYAILPLEDLVELLYRGGIK